MKYVVDRKPKQTNALGVWRRDAVDLIVFGLPT